MKKILLIACIVLLGNFANAQSNYGELKKGVLRLNNGAVISTKDTLRIGIPKDGDERFTYIYEPKHLLGLAGGDAVEGYKIQNNRLIVHYIYSKNDKESNGKKFVVALGYGGAESKYMCDIAQAIECGEIVIPGITPERPKTIITRVTTLPENNNAMEAEKVRLQQEKDKLAEEKRKLEEDKKRLKEEQDKAAAELKAKQVEDEKIRLQQEKERLAEEKRRLEEDKKRLKEEEKDKKKNAVATNQKASGSLLDRINELQKNKEISESEHYQLLKIVTGSGTADNKKDVMKKLKTLRDANKISITEYDELIEKLL